MAKKNMLSNLLRGEPDVQVKRVTHLAVDEDPFERYTLFEAMYDSNNLYQQVQKNSFEAGEWLETLQSIATPCNRSVEFYANRLLMGARVSSTDIALADAINIFLRDSNFDGQKDDYSRELAKSGDLFIKLKNDESKVFMEKIEARHVTNVQTDSRGIVTEIRIDIPQEEGKTYTELWTLDGVGYCATWLHPYGIEADTSELGTPSFYAPLSSYGITFIPIVYAKFKSTNKRAENCFVHAISKIHEANRERSRLAELMYAFNQAIWTAYGSGLSKDGIYNPDPEVKFIKTDGSQVIQYVKGIGEWKSNIPDLDYQSHLAMFKDMRDEITLDLPEIKLNGLEPSQISGRAIQPLLGESINRAKTARSNLSHAIKRLNMMAITLGQFYGFFDRSLGNYVEGDFKHDLVCDAIVPLDPTDKTLMLQQATSAGMPLKSAMRFAEFTPSEIELAMQDKAEEEASLANSFLSNPNFLRDANKTGG